MDSWTQPTDIIENMGGLELFQFTPIIGIDTFPDVVDNEITSDINFMSGYSWYDGYAILRSLQFNENEKQETPGPLFSKEVKGFYPKQTLDILKQFNEMKNQRFIIKVKDHNGYYRIVGSYESPMMFTFSASTGNAPASKNGYQFSFAGSGSEPSPFFNIS